MLYLTGGYIRRYGLPVPAAPGKAAAGYFACAGGTWGLALLLQRITETSGSLLYYSQVPFHYDFVLGYAGAICLFLLFGCLQVPEGRGAELVRRIAPLTFGVYLIHENIDIRDRWLPSLTKLYGPVPRSGWMLLHMAACVLTVFACCLFADWIRSVIFDRAGQLLAGTRFAARLRRMDGGK